jgi:ligand-binding SRPBCC domain-containing protein
MKVYKWHNKQVLPISKSEAWDFFSNPDNLAVLTPPKMRLQIDKVDNRDMYAGKIITFSVTPMAGYRATWVSEITQVMATNYFVDVQLVGPYAMWHHEHRFNEMADGVEVEDLIHYALPLGWLGRLAHKPLVIPKLKELFDYRTEKLTEIFGTIK